MTDIEFYSYVTKETLLNVNWTVVPRKGETINIGDKKWIVETVHYGRFVDGNGDTIPSKVKILIGLKHLRC